MMDNKDFGQELLAEIKKKKILPTPRWRFIFKNASIWAVGVLSLVLGSVAISLIMHMTRFNDFDAFESIGPAPRQFQMIFFAIPFFWVVCLALFTVLVFYNIKKTKNGYRYPAMIIVAGSVLSSFILGGVFFQVGLGRVIDDIAGKNAPFYDQVINPRVRFWFNPDEGRLAGLVTERDGKTLVVVNPDKEWNVVLSDEIEEGGIGIIELDKPARFLGEKKSDTEFLAKKVLPMEAGRGFFDRMPKHKAPPKMMEGSYRLFDKYPELKDSFSEDLIKNKDIIRGKIRSNPREIELFRILGVDKEVLEQLE